MTLWFLCLLVLATFGVLQEDFNVQDLSCLRTGRLSKRLAIPLPATNSARKD
jgi:hypothetical protein